MFHVPNQYRIRDGLMGSDDSFGNDGAFHIKTPPFPGAPKINLNTIASGGEGWEHVSVSIPNANQGPDRTRTPTWFEMCYVKDLFWDPEDCVIQYHPAASEYVNAHPGVLHLWRPIGVEIPRPPAMLVGPK